MTKISYLEFLRSFLASAEQRRHEPETYGDNRMWTAHMLSNDPASPGVIPAMDFPSPGEEAVAYKEQWYTVDGLFISATAGDAIPGHVHCIVEHENGPNWHEEIWKLAHWRCPLKVLIGYDYNDERKSTEIRRQWLKSAILNAQAQISRIDELQGKDPATYLLIVGSKEEDHADRVRWRAMRLCSEDQEPKDIAQILAESKLTNRTLAGSSPP